MTRYINQIIDTHIHFWQPNKVFIPWVKGTQFDNDKDAQQYSEQVSAIGVRQGVYVETDVDARHGLVEAAWIQDYIKHIPASPSFGGISAIVAFAPVDQGEAVRPYLRLLQRLAGEPLRGIRFLFQGLDTQHMMTEDLLTGIRVLGEDEFRLHFEIVIDCHRKPDQFNALINLVRLCPLVSFVLDHMGKPPCTSVPGSREFEHWAKSLRVLATFPNVIACKVSGLITELDGNNDMISAQQLGPFVQVAKDSFGTDRLIFGGDWPICCAQGGSWQKWVNVLLEIVKDWDPLDQSKLFVSNAQRCYRI